MEDYNSWKSGDILKCIRPTDNGVQYGKFYKVKKMIIYNRNNIQVWQDKVELENEQKRWLGRFIKTPLTDINI